MAGFRAMEGTEDLRAIRCKGSQALDSVDLTALSRMLLAFFEHSSALARPWTGKGSSVINAHIIGDLLMG